MKKYVNILDLTLPYLYGPLDLGKFQTLHLYMGVGTWKSSTPELPPGLWNLEKFRSSALHLHNLYGDRLWDLEKF